MDTALYFPYIRVPQTPWFTQVLLYWDQAASIVPRSFRPEEETAGPYMHELMRAGLLRVLSPDDGLLQIEYEGYTEGFLNLLKSRSSPPSATDFTRVHVGKMSLSLFMELKRQGLARSDGLSMPDFWWQVEVGTAGLYMAYLAGAMSAAVPGTFPVTDRPENIGTLAGDTGTLREKLAALRYRVITEALPAPRGPVPAEELRAFKEENAERLRRCRLFLDDKLADLATMTDAELREVRTAHILQSIKDDVANLQEQMNRKRWPGVVLAGFGGVLGTALTAAGDIASGGAAMVLGLGLGAAALQIGSDGYSAVEQIRAPRYDRRAPLVYAALAGRLG